MELFRSPIIFNKKNRDVTRKIAIVPAGPGVGASFTAAQMALFEKGRVNVIEMGTPYFYQAYGMEKRFAGRPFTFFEDKLMGEGIGGTENIEFGINWFLRRVGSPSMSLEKMLKIISFPPSGLNIFDFSSAEEESVISCLSEMDEIYIVIDPLPTKLLSSAAYIERLCLLFPSAKILVNKMNSGVHKNELKKFLGHSKIKEIPFYSPEIIYRAEYNCCPPEFH